MNGGTEFDEFVCSYRSVIFRIWRLNSFGSNEASGSSSAGNIALNGEMLTFSCWRWRDADAGAMRSGIIQLTGNNSVWKKNVCAHCSYIYERYEKPNYSLSLLFSNYSLLLLCHYSAQVRSLLVWFRWGCAHFNRDRDFCFSQYVKRYCLCDIIYLENVSF